MSREKGYTRYTESRRRRRKARLVRLLLVFGPLVVIGGGGALALSLLWPADRLTADARSLGLLKLAPVAEHVAGVSAVDQSGRRFPVEIRAGKIYPVGAVPPGDRLKVRVTVRRAGYVAWLVGKTRHVDLVVRTPEAAHVTETILRPRPGKEVTVRFDHPVSVVALTLPGQPQQRLVFGHPRTEVAIGVKAAGRTRFGNVLVAAAPRSWVSLSHPVRLSWFPAGARLQALVRPAPGASILPTTPITLSFSEPVASIFGSTHPKLDPSAPGTWTQTGVNTLTFRPSGEGFGLGARVALTLPAPTDVTAGGKTRTLSSLSWSVPIGTTLRLEQLLSKLGYLPLSWQPSGADVPATVQAQELAAIEPPLGDFTWRYPDTPAVLKALWSPGGWTRMTQGAVMAFQNDHGLTVDGIPGPQVWHALIAAALDGSPAQHSYSYVLVHRSVPQTLVLWNNGQTILTARVNTGVPQAPTPFGTHAVFLHIPSGTMRGTNPDGSKYVDHGIPWISYFNGGEAIHGFNRATYGYPQSVGCVEAPVETAGKIWPYTPIGTLVSIVP